jgi:outer membrane cobalamin receptor
MIALSTSTFVFLLLLSSNLFSQTVIDGMSLEDLMNVDIEVATETKQTLREAPGIVTVINAADIKRIGARDLKEVLETVPGITFGQDVIGVISTINRGIWGQEGRMLVLVDGVEMNEVSYGTIQLTNHFPSEHIKKIEIIRGPGSANYGGFAELGVINIITKSGEDLDGVEVSTLYATTADEASRRTVSFMFGKKIENLSLSFKGTSSIGNESDQNYTDSTGTTVSLKQNAQINETFLNLGLEYKGLYSRYIKDHYETRNPILWGNLDQGGQTRADMPKDFLTDAINIGYNGDISSNLKAHFYSKHKVQLPWYQPDITNQVRFGNSWRRKITREVFGAKFFYNVNKKMYVNFGVENQNDVSESLNDQDRARSTDDVHGHNNSRTATLNNSSVFTQLQYKADLANVTVGLRQDTPDSYDSTLVPRLGLTKVINNFHFKFLHAKAFRAPVIENISVNPEIKPEITTTSEFEFGYTKEQSAFTFNIFNTAIEDIIVYSYDTQERYYNYDLLSTNGFEMEFKYISNSHNLKTNLSYYQLNELKNGDPFKSSEDSKSTFGAPRYKVWFSDSYQLNPNLFITPSFVYYKDIYAKDWISNKWQDTKLDDQLISNLFLSAKNFYLKGFELGGGIKNLFGTDVRLAQPYVKPGDIQAGPYPGQSREYILKVGYSKHF